MPAVSGMGSINFTSPLHLTRYGSDAQGRNATPKVEPVQESTRRSVDARSVPAPQATSPGATSSSTPSSRLLFSTDELPRDNTPRRSAIEQIFDTEQASSAKSQAAETPPVLASSKFLKTLGSVRAAESGSRSTDGPAMTAGDGLNAASSGTGANDPASPKQVGRMDKTA